MNNIRTKLSIGLPVHNKEAFIKDTIDSLLAQTFQDFELIISDNWESISIKVEIIQP
ncbi:MAG: glycosyltransferase [Calothrix sp. SM1_7_51]|nr:glycosyltransferase [Calothrix sp. SM1_7_51]